MNNSVNLLNHRVWRLSYMKTKISLVTIWTDEIEVMKKFYREVLGFKVKTDLGEYVEFVSEGVRFAICERKVMHDYSREFKDRGSGQKFELAFPCTDKKDVDVTYEKLVLKGSKAIKPPFDTPWNQRCALFADPDGNIHEIFCELDG